jgi:pimeloyl-ACP methyl ester carboxylesterase
LPAIQGILEGLEVQYPEASGIKDNAAFGVEIYSITYKTKYKNEEVTASGLVCIPFAQQEFPVVSFQNGTNTKHASAPSVNALNFNYLLLEIMASNGYVICIPDYIGFGASAGQLHPYYQKESTTDAVIDMLKASRELLLEEGILAGSNGNFYLMGYSQGGWATLGVMDEFENSSPGEFNIVGVSCGAGAYDLIAMSNYVLNQDTFPGPLYLPYFVYSEQVYGALTEPLETYFKQPYAGRIPMLFNGTYSNGEVNSQLNDTISKLLTDDLINNFNTSATFASLRTALIHNSISGWNTTIPVRFYHGTADLDVPPSQSLNIYNQFIGSGSASQLVQHIEFTGRTHETGVIPWGIATIEWFNELETQ